MPSISTLSETPAWAETDRRLMARALELAERGAGQVSPGPLVGCVITNSINEVVGEGFFVYEKVKHAETLALHQAGKRARGGTAYVSLEPHAHQGRTAPCTVALIEAGITRVLAPIEDTNPQVSGRGFAHLREAGLTVEVGLMAREASVLNEKYTHFMRTQLPFIHLKVAMSLDGKIATRTGDSRWITGTEARRRVHQLRHEYDAIMVGAGTVVVDDPLLTDRSGLPRRRPLMRIVLDEKLRLSSSSKLVETAAEVPLLVITGKNADDLKVNELRSRGAEVLSIGTRDLVPIFRDLAVRSVQSVLVEGGPTLAGSLFDERLINKVTFFVAPKIIGGRDAPNTIAGAGPETMGQALDLQEITVARHGQDLEITGYPPTNF